MHDNAKSIKFAGYNANVNRPRACSIPANPFHGQENRVYSPDMDIIHHFTRNRPRLSITILMGIGVALILPDHWIPITRALAGWNVTVWSYLFTMGWLMMRAHHIRVRTIAEQEDKSAVAELAILSIASVISLVAIVLELATTKNLNFSERLIHYAFTGSNVLGSWCMVDTLFTFHYAHLFYRSESDRRPLRFADDEPNPDYWDFLYFSFTIAVAVQTSDVVLMTRSMRKTVLAQSVLSFLFNTAILGLTINIAAGLIGSS